MAAIYDAHPWLSQYELWAILTGREAPPDLSAKEEVYWGTRLEEIVIDEYEKRTGREVTRENREIRHPAIEIMGGEVDGWILASTNAPIGTGILDAKTTNLWSKAAGLGWIASTNRTTTSKRPREHYRRIMVWESRLFDCNPRAGSGGGVRQAP